MIIPARRAMIPVDGLKIMPTSASSVKIVIAEFVLMTKRVISVN